MPTWGRLYWPFFLILVAVEFAIPEIYAIFTDVRNTLSDYARLELHVRAGVNIHTLAWGLSLAAWLLFVLTMTAHIWFARWYL